MSLHRRPSLLIFVFAAALPAGLIAQATKPNFSGPWLLVAPAEIAAASPGQYETIVHTATTITFGHPSEGGSHQLTYYLDGREHPNTLGGTRIVTIARWDGQKLILTDKVESRPSTTKTIHIDANGSLIMELNPLPEGLPATGKFVYRKR
jgi:hypothetical protein